MPTQPVAVKREPQRYTLEYDFDGMVNFKHPFQLAPALELAKAMPATRVEIVGYRSAALLSDGTVLQEQPDLARRRAEQVAELLRGAGLTAPRYAGDAGSMQRPLPMASTTIAIAASRSRCCLERIQAGRQCSPAGQSGPETCPRRSQLLQSKVSSERAEPLPHSHQPQRTHLRQRVTVIPTPLSITSSCR